MSALPPPLPPLPQIPSSSPSTAFRVGIAFAASLVAFGFRLALTGYHPPPGEEAFYQGQLVGNFGAAFLVSGLCAYFIRNWLGPILGVALIVLGSAAPLLRARLAEAAASPLGLKTSPNSDSEGKGVIEVARRFSQQRIDFAAALDALDDELAQAKLGEALGFREPDSVARGIEIALRYRAAAKAVADGQVEIVEQLKAEFVKAGYSLSNPTVKGAIAGAAKANELEIPLVNQTTYARLNVVDAILWRLNVLQKSAGGWSVDDSGRLSFTDATALQEYNDAVAEGERASAYYTSTYAKLQQAIEVLNKKKN